MNTTDIIMIAIIAMAVIYMITSARNKEQEDPASLLDPLIDRGEYELQAIKTYFFNSNNKFSFEKFSDYILCINENMDIEDMAQCILELDLLIKCSSGLGDKMLEILNFSRAITKIDSAEFENIKQSLREKKYTGTYQDIAYIYYTTLFYLKNEVYARKDKLGV